MVRDATLSLKSKIPHSSILFFLTKQITTYHLTTTAYYSPFMVICGGLGQSVLGRERNVTSIIFITPWPCCAVLFQSEVVFSWQNMELDCCFHICLLENHYVNTVPYRKLLKYPSSSITSETFTIEHVKAMMCSVKTWF